MKYPLPDRIHVYKLCKTQGGEKWEKVGENGIFALSLRYISTTATNMSGLLGEFEVSMDPKGRVKVPSALLKQLTADDADRFVITRGFEKCLVLYPYSEWQKVSARLNGLNTFVKKNRDFVRYFMSGATELKLDSGDRVLLPKPLQAYAGISKELVLSAFQGKVEIWDKAKYTAEIDMDSDDFAGLAEEVMGGPDDE
jgi:MraZ protein